MKERILGIDPGLARLGFGAIAGYRGAQGSSEVSVIDYGVITTPSGVAESERLRTLFEDLHQVIHLIQPTQISLEKLFFYKMGNTIAVAQARGVIILVLSQHKLPITEFTPNQIKLALTGSGNADKKAMQEAVKRELSLSKFATPDDASDALGAALTAWFNL